MKKLSEIDAANKIMNKWETIVTLAHEIIEIEKKCEKKIYIQGARVIIEFDRLWRTSALESIRDRESKFCDPAGNKLN